MATVIIPTLADGTPHYDFTTELDGVTFLLELLWMDRPAAWFLSINDVDGTPLLSARKLVLNVFLTHRFKNPALPAGEFHLLDTSGQDLEAGFYDLGQRVLLLYTEAADWPAGFLR